MGHSWTNVAAAPVGDANGYLDTTTMANGAYTLIANAPTFGARHVTMARAVINAADTPGTITLVGKDLSGQTISEVMIPGANGVTVTSTKFFASLATATQAGWVIGAATADTILIGWDDLNAVATGSGTFHGIVVNTTAAGSITIADASGTIAVLPSNVAVGYYGPYDVNFGGYLRVEPVAASNITVIHSGSLPGTYSM